VRGKRLNRGFANQCAYRARRCLLWVSMITCLSVVAQNSAAPISFQIPKRDFVAGKGQFDRGNGDELLKFTVPGKANGARVSISISFINCKGSNLVGPGGGIPVPKEGF
jgi:hypothetical protein